MGSRLRDNRSSEYIEGYNRLRPNQAADIVYVYVEDIDDVPFWQKLFSRHESSSLKFKVCPPDGESIRRGKPNVLYDEDGQLRNNYGEFLLGAIDSDYHYLLQDSNNISGRINSSPYIFQTYTYSIENYKCYSHSLKNLIVDITKVDSEHLSFVEFLKLFSITIYPLFLRLVYLAKNDDKTVFTEEELKSIMLLFKDCDLEDYGSSELNELKEVIARKIEVLESKYSFDCSTLSQLEEFLSELGVTEENCYLFINGHILFDNVILELFNTICLRIRKEYIDSMRDLACDGKEIGDRKKQYDNCTGLSKNRSFKDILKQALSNNYSFTDCFLYNKIEADIEAYVESHFQPAL